MTLAYDTLQVCRSLLAALLMTTLLVLSACHSPGKAGENDPGTVDPARQQSKNEPAPEPAPALVAEREAAIEEVVVTGQALSHDKSRMDRSRDLAVAKQIAQPMHLMVRPSAPFYQDEGRERYPDVSDNGMMWALQNPVSTFSVDVDTAAYANLRRQLYLGHLPDPDSIRVEEMINYFTYDYPRARSEDTPFSIYTEMGPSPWHAERKLIHIGINGWQPQDDGNLPPANLVFLIDVSGSMQAPNKLPLLKSAMKMLTNQLRPEDSVAIVVYAGAAGAVLEPTRGDNKAAITDAIDNLRAGGSTNGEAGIKLAYSLARKHFKQDGVNRVMLATDGDFNVGTSNPEALERLVERERKSGVALTVLGFGTGNYNDNLMQKIAQIGNGNAAYIDNLNEARKVLVEELGATLNIIAKDTKVQIEFNPAVVETYRLVGYETRHLNREDFDNDKVDAGDIGAGHTVTALYEITLRGDGSTPGGELRYQEQDFKEASTDEIAFVKLRYKEPESETSKLITQPLRVRDLQESLAETSADYRFAAAVAWLGQHLRQSKHTSEDLGALIELAEQTRGNDPHGYRSEFINLARTVSALDIAATLPAQAPGAG